MIHPYRSVVPSAPPSAWVAGAAHVIGDVVRGEDVSINDHLAAGRAG